MVSMCVDVYRIVFYVALAIICTYAVSPDCHDELRFTDIDISARRIDAISAVVSARTPCSQLKIALQSHIIFRGNGIGIEGIDLRVFTPNLDCPVFGVEAVAAGADIDRFVFDRDLLIGVHGVLRGQNLQIRQAV